MYLKLCTLKRTHKIIYIHRKFTKLFSRNVLHKKYGIVLACQVFLSALWFYKEMIYIYILFTFVKVLKTIFYPETMHKNLV